MKEQARSALPLQGVRIIDWTTQQAGPSATQLCADLGAEVIKVEAPGGGDAARGLSGYVKGTHVLAHGMPYRFEILNRNKKSMVMDLRKRESQEIMYALVAKSDVFVQNFKQGVAKKMNLDYETLQKYNPSLIYANCSGFGPKGALAAQPAMDASIAAASGIMLGIGEPGMPPIFVPGGLFDHIAGLMLMNAIMVALFYRERTGIGQEVNVSMLGSMIWVMTNNFLHTLMENRARTRQFRSHQRNPLVNYYRCRDDRWILLSHYRSGKYWSTLCRAMGREELIDDPRFCNPDVREKNNVALIAILDEVFAENTLMEWLDIFASEDLIYSPIKDYGEVIEDPQVLENDYLVTYDHPVLGKIKEIGIPMDFGKTPGSIRVPAPRLGEHTDEVLTEILGLSRDEIAKLRGLQAIG